MGLVLIASVYNECSDEHGHTHSLIRVFSARIHKIQKKMESQTKHLAFKPYWIRQKEEICVCPISFKNAMGWPNYIFLRL